LFDEDTGKSWEICVKTVRENGNIIRFEVQDNGAGMRQETQDKLFSSFFSTKGGRGTGIGLLVTKKLIEEHGGTIQFTSQPGEGTTFILRLPFEKVKTV
jgi:signal transduction histidine kinase